MADLKKPVKLKSSQNKVIMYKEQESIAFQLLVTAQNLKIKIGLQEAMGYQLTAVPYSLGSTDGLISKTSRALGLQCLTRDKRDSQSELESSMLLIMDGNAVFHSMTDIQTLLMGHVTRYST